jgi:hypothetical protein
VNGAPVSSYLQGPKPLSLILRVGLIAGTFDIGDALIFSHFRGVTPSMVFHYIASGLIGMRAFEMGAGAVALGVAIHYAIALAWTTIFYVASRKFTVLSRRPVISGLLYGLAVYLFMNLVALPLSGVPRAHKAVTMAARVNGVLAVMLFIGLTISLLMRRSMSRR